MTLRSSKKLRSPSSSAGVNTQSQARNNIMGICQSKEPVKSSNDRIGTGEQEPEAAPVAASSAPPTKARPQTTMENNTPEEDEDIEYEC